MVRAINFRGLDCGSRHVPPSSGPTASFTAALKICDRDKVQNVARSTPQLAVWPTRAGSPRLSWANHGSRYQICCQCVEIRFMRFLTFLHSFEPGGVERIALRLVRHWRELGVDAPLFLGRADGAMANDVGAGLAFICPKQWRIGSRSWETIWMIFMLPRVVRDLRPDVLFCAGNTYLIVAVALKLLLGDDCPPIIAKISNDLNRRDAACWKRLVYRSWLRISGRFLDHVIGMEDSVAGEIGEALRIPAHAISIIPDPALSLPLIGQLRETQALPDHLPKGRNFVAVGRLVPQKNLSLMLRAFRQGRRPGDRLTIVGDGPERRKLEKLIKRLGLSGCVALVGYRADPALLLCEFDVLLLSSNYEGVPAVILEALAAGLSIISTDCGCISAVLLHGALGELVKVGDEAMLARAITQARYQRQDREAALAQARRFTIESASVNYLYAMRTTARFADSAVSRSSTKPEILTEAAQFTVT